MGNINRVWKKAVTATMTATLLLQSGFVFAEETVPQQWLELTAPVLETEAGSATSASLTIGNWLDYSDYGIERDDVIGGTYTFALTTKDAQDVVIDDEQLAYCVQSYFMTPLPGDHSSEMIDQVSSIGGEHNVHKVFYYGFGGVAYDAAEFDAVLKQGNSEYYENVYQQLSDEEKEELAYILTHSASTYAYFNDGTDLEDYFALQFQVKYGDDWEKQYGYFEEIELNAAGIEDGDMNLYGATYGMTETGIELAKKWYQVLTSKETPGLSVEESDGVFTFNGNSRNEALEMDFVVPDGFVCEIFCTDGSNEVVEELKTANVCPGDSFVLKLVDGIVSTEVNGITDLNVEVEGALAGTEKEAWNLVLIETNKGNAQAVSRRQQDIAAVSMIDAGRTSLEFGMELQKGSIEFVLADEVQQAVSGAVLGVYYDEACTMPMTQDGEAVEMTTDAEGKAYLEFVVNDNLTQNGNKLYVKELVAPEGHALDETVYEVTMNSSTSVVNERVFEATDVVISCKVNLTGRPLKAGEFTFDLVQVTDVTGETVVEGGVVATATNDADGNVVFEGIKVDEPGTYYYKVMSEDGSFVAMAEVTVDENNKGKLIVTVSYPNGQPSFDKVYEASGEAVLEGVHVSVEEGELHAGDLGFEVKNQEEEVVSTGTNDADGNVDFEPIPYTQDDIGHEYEYTVSMVDEDATTDNEGATIIVKVEDSDESDGTLKITQEAVGEGMEFAVNMISEETESETTTEAVSEVAEAASEVAEVTETEAASEVTEATETETVSETAEATETETVSETAEATETETVSETTEATETETLSETTKETEDESKTEAATETEAAEEGNGYVLPISISFIILLILFIIRWYRRRNKK